MNTPQDYSVFTGSIPFDENQGPYRVEYDRAAFARSDRNDFPWQLVILAEFEEDESGEPPFDAERASASKFESQILDAIRPADGFHLAHVFYEDHIETVFRVRDPDETQQRLTDFIEGDLSMRPFRFEMIPDRDWDLASDYESQDAWDRHLKWLGDQTDLEDDDEDELDDDDWEEDDDEDSFDEEEEEDDADRPLETASRAGAGKSDAASDDDDDDEDWDDDQFDSQFEQAMEEITPGFRALALGDFDQALTLLTEELNSETLSDEERCDYHMALGTAHLGLRRLDEAEREMREAVRLAPEDSGAIAKLASILIDQSRLGEAEEWLRRGLTIDRYNGELHYEFARIHGTRGEKIYAFERFYRAVQLDPMFRLQASQEPSLELLQDNPVFQALTDPENFSADDDFDDDEDDEDFDDWDDEDEDKPKDEKPI